MLSWIIEFDTLTYRYLGFGTTLKIIWEIYELKMVGHIPLN